MKKRQNLVERFSTFILWNNNWFQTWAIDPRLRRSMERYLAQESSTSEQYWTLFWHTDWLRQREDIGDLETSRISHHLYAYLQEPCYRAAENIYRSYQSRSQYTIEDYFNLGFLNLDNILSKFNPRLNPNLAAHAFSQLKWRILDEMRPLDRTFGHTIWSLLLNCTEARLKKALINDGIPQQNIIDNYSIAWDCYKELYPQAKVKSNGKLQEPSTKTWEQITKAYNQEQPNSKCDSEIIKKWLKTCGQALLNYLSISTISSNAPFSQGEAGELQDIFPDEQRATPPEQLEIEEEIEESQAVFREIHAWLTGEIELLNTESSSILLMLYEQNSTQTEIGENLDIPQYSVSRKLTKIQKNLTENFIKWSNDNLNISLTANDIITINEALKEWLKYHYQDSHDAR